MPADPPVEEEGDGDLGDAPWHFKLLLIAFALYLGYRAVQGIIWVVTEKLF